MHTHVYAEKNPLKRRRFVANCVFVTIHKNPGNIALMWCLQHKAKWQTNPNPSSKAMCEDSSSSSGSTMTQWIQSHILVECMYLNWISLAKREGERESTRGGVAFSEFNFRVWFFVWCSNICRHFWHWTLCLLKFMTHFSLLLTSCLRTKHTKHANFTHIYMYNSIVYPRDTHRQIFAFCFVFTKLNYVLFTGIVICALTEAPTQSQLIIGEKILLAPYAQLHCIMYLSLSQTQ